MCISLFVNLGGTVIKRLIALALVVLLLAPTEFSFSAEAVTKSKVTPSPSPAWPPKGFKKSKVGEVYAKIPTTKELVRLASADKKLTAELAREEDGVRLCEKYSCGAVQVVSLTICRWWEITSEVKGPTSIEDKTIKTFGKVRTTYRSTSAKKYVTILIVSAELRELKHSVGGIKAECHEKPATEIIPSTTYTKIS